MARSEIVSGRETKSIGGKAQASGTCNMRQSTLHRLAAPKEQSSIAELGTRTKVIVQFAGF